MIGTSKQLTEQKSKTLVVEGTKLKILLVTILIGAVLGSAAPFIHMLFPVKAQEKILLEKKYENKEITAEVFQKQSDILWEKHQFIGFTNFRRFLFAIGLPVALFFCSFLMMFITRFSENSFVKKSGFFTSLSFQIISLFFILWTIYPFDSEKYDFGESTYFTLLIISSILLAFGFYFISKALAYRRIETQYLVRLANNLKFKLFKILDKHEPKDVADIEKDKINDEVYDTFEKVMND